MKQLLKIKNKNVNADKIVSIDFVQNSELTKMWAVIHFDTLNNDLQKLFIEVKNEQEYLELINQINIQL